MSRDLTTDLANEIVKSVIRPALFVYAQFNSGPVRVWTGIGSISWDGHNWLGVGRLLGISVIEESSDLTATSFSLSLSSVPSDMLSIVLTEIRQGYPCKVWLAMLDSNGTVIDAPYQAMAGRIDAGTIAEGVETSVASITVENQLVDFNRPRDRRFTNQDQQKDFPGDPGFEYVPQVQSWNGAWGVPGGRTS